MKWRVWRARMPSPATDSQIPQAEAQPLHLYCTPSWISGSPCSFCTQRSGSVSMQRIQRLKKNKRIRQDAAFSCKAQPDRYTDQPCFTCGPFAFFFTYLLHIPPAPTSPCMHTWVYRALQFLHPPTSRIPISQHDQLQVMLEAVPVAP